MKESPVIVWPHEDESIREAFAIVEAGEEFGAFSSESDRSGHVAILFDDEMAFVPNEAVEEIAGQ